MLHRCHTTNTCQNRTHGIPDRLRPVRGPLQLPPKEAQTQRKSHSPTTPHPPIQSPAHQTQKRWISFLMLSWGAATMGLGGAHNYAQVTGIRFLLGGIFSPPKDKTTLY